MITILKTNYEKVTLFFCLFLSACCLTWLLTIITDKIPHIPDIKTDNRYITINPDLYPSTPPSSKHWLITSGYDKNKTFHQRTDLMKAIEASRCLHCSHLIPLADYKSKKTCSYCQNPLKIPKIPTKQNLDSDSDGIPDLIETSLNLNPNNPDDALNDLDKDGFSNIFEFQTSKTDLNDAKSRPLLIQHLKLKKIERKKLPLRFTKVTTHQSKDKSTWFAFGKIGKSSKINIWKLNDTIRIGKKQYKITDINYKEKVVYDPKLKTEVKVDTSEIELIQHKTKIQTTPISARINHTIYLPDKYITLRDTHLKQTKRAITTGDKITLGNSTTGKEKYIVAHVDYRKKKILLRKAEDTQKSKETYELSLK